MKRSLLDRLVDPTSGAPLRLRAERTDGAEITEGILETDAAWYPIEEGVPRLLTGRLRASFGPFAERHGLAEAGGPERPDEGRRQDEQARTAETFSDKWRRFQDYGFEASHRAFLEGWYVEKLGLSSVDDLRAFYAGKRRILEIGPGSGFNTKFMAESSPGTVTAVDISDAAFTTYRNTRDLPNCHVVQADLMALPLPDGAFDFVIADGVLHHTPSTRDAVAALYRKVEPGGQFFFYVYKAMGAARRFCDEHLRRAFTGLDPEACYARVQGITELGRALSALGARVTLKHGIPELGIPPGDHDVQRLIYYNFLKCFWNDAFDWETNNMVNFDWYHPHHAWQHTEAEVRGWLDELGAVDVSFQDANPNGLSVLLRRPAE